jgi:glutamate-ammonia-ligase adenylyltransferase
LDQAATGADQLRTDEWPTRRGRDRIGTAIEWITDARPEAAERLAAGEDLTATVATVVAASPWLARICATEPAALDVLDRIHRDPVPGGAPDVKGDPVDHLKRIRDLGILHIAARDLLGLDSFDTVVGRLSHLADRLLDEAVQEAGPAGRDLAVIGLGKLGASELNYASDVDLVLIGPDPSGGVEHDPRPFLELARSVLTVDLDLRPEGRSGALVRTLASYEHYWSRWAQPWEFQALLKTRAVTGAGDLGRAFEERAAEQVWGRPLGVEELRALRQMKARAEQELARRNLAEREIKRGRGGIRDIEFAVQLLQLVHGRSDPALRQPSTLACLSALAAGGYVAPGDAEQLAAAYRFLRTVEHRLQLYEGQPVHTLPSTADGLAALAEVMGYRADGRHSAAQQFDRDLRAHRQAARSIHERLFFRPLLEAFTATRGRGPSAAALSEAARAERLAAFGFADAARTGQAVSELTRGFSRMSVLMQRSLPLLLDWLSTTPDPDQGLLGLRTLAGAGPARDRLVAVCRESPAGARQLCQLLGTAHRFARDMQRHPEALTRLAAGSFPAPSDAEDLRDRASRSIGWRTGAGRVGSGLRQFVESERLRIGARDVLQMDDGDVTGRALSDLADAAIAAAIEAVNPPMPFAVIGLGRLGGREVGYGSDLDLLTVWDDAGWPAADPEVAEEAARAVIRLVAGDSPSTGSYRVDLNLRPEGRQGPTSRSLASYAAYYERWAEPWERQSLLRGRYVAGDVALAERFAALAQRFIWDRPLTEADILALRRSKARMEKERVPAGDDPKFHLKLGPGSISDVEWTVQLLQLRNRVAATNTMAALELLERSGAIDAGDAATLRSSYRFCRQARNRLSLIRETPGDALPVAGRVLTTLAHSLGYSSPELRNEYARLTRRARQVTERLFYGA